MKPAAAAATAICAVVIAFAATQISAVEVTIPTKPSALAITALPSQVGKRCAPDGECHTAFEWQEKLADCVERLNTAADRLVKAPQDARNPEFQARVAEGDATNVACMRFVNRYGAAFGQE